MVWNEMKTFFRNQFCTTPEEVVIGRLRNTLTQEKCKNCINNIHEVSKLEYNKLTSFYKRIHI